MIDLIFSDEDGLSQMFGPDVYGIRFQVQRTSTFDVQQGKQCVCAGTRPQYRAQSQCERHPIRHTFYWLKTEGGEDIGAAVIGVDNARALVSGRLTRGSDATA